MFEQNYATLKADYSSALQNSISETDRPKQCMLIKRALDTNQRLTALVQEFLVGAESGTCKVSRERIHALREDIEKYKKQYVEIQQGKDRLHSLQIANNSLTDKLEVLRGVQFIYIIMIGLGILVLVILILYSGIKDVLNANPVVPVVSRGLAKPGYF